MRHGQPIGTRSTVQMDLIILLQPQLAQPSTQLEGQLFILAETLEGVRAQLVKRPLFVDQLLHAIDDLLHLLIVDVGADETSRSDCVVVAVHAGPSAKDIVDGGDVVGRSENKFFPGGRVSSRDGLAGDRFAVGHFDGEGGLLRHAWLKRGL